MMKTFIINNKIIVHHIYEIELIKIKINSISCFTKQEVFEYLLYILFIVKLKG